MEKTHQSEDRELVTPKENMGPYDSGAVPLEQTSGAPNSLWAYAIFNILWLFSPQFQWYHVPWGKQKGNLEAAPHPADGKISCSMC